MTGIASVWEQLCSMLVNLLGTGNNLCSASNRITKILDDGAAIYSEEVASERELRALKRLQAPQ
jgi:hypothetical protein